MPKRKARSRVIPLALAAALAGAALLFWWIQSWRLSEQGERRSVDLPISNTAPQGGASEEFTAAERKSLEDILRGHQGGEKK